MKYESRAFFGNRMWCVFITFIPNVQSLCRSLMMLFKVKNYFRFNLLHQLKNVISRVLEQEGIVQLLEISASQHSTLNDAIDDAKWCRKPPYQGKMALWNSSIRSANINIRGMIHRLIHRLLLWRVSRARVCLNCIIVKLIPTLYLCNKYKHRVHAYITFRT